MLHISTSVSANGVATMLLEGNLVPPWVAQLEELALGHLGSGRTVVLDLTGVRAAGPETARLLKRLRRNGPVRIVHCPRLVEEFLDDE